MSDTQIPPAKKKPAIIFRRPVSHHIIIAIYGLLPLIVIISFMLFSKSSISYIIKYYYNYFGLALLLAPIVAIGLYFANKTSWILFLIHSCFALYDTIYKVIKYPGYYYYSLLVAVLVVIAAAGYTLQKDFRSPYFHVFIRGWRLKKRQPMELNILFNSQPAKITDLSVTGCFVPFDNFTYDGHKNTKIQFLPIEASILIFEAQIMRQMEDGLGLRFINITPEQKKFLQKKLKM